MRPTRPKTSRNATGNLKAFVKDPIEVYCRIRPISDEAYPTCLKAVDDKTITLCPTNVSQNSKQVNYIFKRVFDAKTTQEILFKEVCLPLVQDLLQGNSGLLFTYGITSSGKTHTMTGTSKDGGLLPRTLDVIFNSIKHCSAKKYVFKPDKLSGFYIQSNAEAMLDQQKELGMYNRNKRSKKEPVSIGDWSSHISDTNIIEDILPDVNFAVFISYMEIYNNYIFDLLEDSTNDKRCSKMLRDDDKTKSTFVIGLSEIEVKTVEEALELFYRGKQRRTVAHTNLNRESSRSHSVFTIRVVQAPLDPQGAEVLQDVNRMTISQLSLVDLAGSERSVRTQTGGQKIKEAGNINKNLMTLRRCIEALRNSEKPPCRECRLTQLFKAFFEGKGKIRMIVCVNPRADDYEETIQVMKFAEMTQEVVISRPTPVSTPTAFGLTPGRGLMYREALRKARETGVSVSDVLPPVVYSLGPDFPQLIINTSDDESVYINLIEFLTSRIARRNTFVQDLSHRQEEFRKNLMAVDKENIQLKQETSLLRMDLSAREQQVQGLEFKLSSSEETIEMLQKQVDEFKSQAQNATAEVVAKERILSDQMREMDRMKTKWQDKFASEKDRLKRIMERRLAEKQAELERKMCLTSEKFRQLREILNEDDWEYFGDININIPAPIIPSTTSSESSAPVTRGRQKSASETAEPSAETRFTRTRSAADFNHGVNGPNVQKIRSELESIFNKENNLPSSSQGSRNIAVANPRHRRSTSTGDVWIEHKPIGNLELNTVLQPAMKKKKSVSKLEVKDVINSDVSKYVLQHQEQDSQGEVETQLFKADVIPSAGGGAQVIFNDVEKLRQVSPPPVYNFRKRSGDSLPLNEIENRCAVSTECHGQPSKRRK